MLPSCVFLCSGFKKQIEFVISTYLTKPLFIQFKKRVNLSYRKKTQENLFPEQKKEKTKKLSFHHHPVSNFRNNVQRERERERERERDRQEDRQTERRTKRQIARHTDTRIETKNKSEKINIELVVSTFFFMCFVHEFYWLSSHFVLFPFDGSFLFLAGSSVVLSFCSSVLLFFRCSVHLLFGPSVLPFFFSYFLLFVFLLVQFSNLFSGKFSHLSKRVRPSVFQFVHRTLCRSVRQSFRSS